MLAKLPIFCGTGRASMRRVCLKVWRNASSYDETVQLKKSAIFRAKSGIVSILFFRFGQATHPEFFSSGKVEIVGVATRHKWFC